MSDELWARVEPLLPVVSRRADHPGRKRLDDRKALSGILFVLYTGIPWEFLPQELGFGSGMTWWRRLRDWNDAGVWQLLHESLPAELDAVGALDWSRAVIDGSHVRATSAPSRIRRSRWPDPAVRDACASVPGAGVHASYADRNTPLSPARFG